MKATRSRRIVGDLFGSATRSSGPRARAAREIQITAHRGPGDGRKASTFTGLARPNRYY